MQDWFKRWINQQWQTLGLAQVFLLPLAGLFAVLSASRRWLYAHHILASHKLAVPVIVVGNISVGGTGKTPLVIYLATQLKLAGFTPGIISRGYGGNSTGEVTANSNPASVGDEPVLIAQRSACPVWVNANRVAAGKALLQAHPACNVLLSDDGLQHYALQRAVEIAVVHARRSFGNQLLLPAGPLREKTTRLQTVDAIVDAGSDIAFGFYVLGGLPPVFAMTLQGALFENLADATTQPASYFAGKNLVAIAGIGNPQAFFNQLSHLGLQFESVSFADHHAFSAQDFAAFTHKTILMTEKDAVKCKAFKLADAWYLPVNAKIENSQNKQTLIQLIVDKISVK
jgi:tetraacyldisaccharide 4'-kinase